MSIDDRFVISGSSDKSIKVFDLQTMQHLHHFADAHQGTIVLCFLLSRHSSCFIDRVWSVAVSSDNRFIVSGSSDKSIKVFDLQTNQQLHHFADAHRGTIILSFLLRHSSSFIDIVRSVAVSSNNRFIVSGSDDKSIKVFNLQTKQQLHHFADAHQGTIILLFLLPCHSSSFIGGVNSVAMSSDNRFIVSGSDDKSIKVFDLQTNQQLHHFADAHQGTIILSFLLHCHSSSFIDRVWSVVVSSDNRFIVSGSSDKSIKVFDLQTKQHLYNFADAHQGTIIFSFLPPRHLSSFIGAVNSVAVSRNNRFIVSGSSDKSIKMFDLQAKQELHHFADAHQGTIILSFLLHCHSSSFIGAVRLVAVSNDNRFIVSGSDDRSIKVFDLQTKQQLHHFADAHQGTIILSFLLLRHLSSFIGGVNSLAVLSDNRFIVSGSDDKSIKMFDLQTKQRLHHFADAHRGTIIFFFLLPCYSSSFIGAVRLVAVSSDNRFIVSGSSDKSIKVLDLKTKEELHHFADAHKGTIILSPATHPLS